MIIRCDDVFIDQKDGQWWWWIQDWRDPVEPPGQTWHRGPFSTREAAVDDYQLAEMDRGFSEEGNAPEAEPGDDGFVG